MSVSQTASRVQEAQALREAGQVEEAICLLTEILEQEPNDMRARELLGDIYYDLNDYKRARRQYRYVFDRRRHEVRIALKGVGDQRIKNGEDGEKQKARRLPRFLSVVGREGFEPPKAEPANLQSAPFGHLGTCPFSSAYYTHLVGIVNPRPGLCGNSLGHTDPTGFFGILQVRHLRAVCEHPKPHA